LSRAMPAARQHVHAGSQHRSQRGVVLLLIVLALVALGGAALFVGLASKNDPATALRARVQLGNDSLGAVRQAMIGYLLSPPNAAVRAGTLPTPDSLANGNYDGNEDSSCLGTGTNGLPAVGGSSTSKRCLGKVPWKALGLEFSNPPAHDPIGEVPWLAVSANLVNYDTCLLVLNSDSMALNSPAMANCPSLTPPYPQPTQLAHPWLTVIDANGVTLSNRVAAVIILPGSPLTTETRSQARSSASPGNPRDYLDDIKLPLGCTTGCTTYDNAGLSNAFVSIPPGSRYPVTAQNAALQGESIPFNDQVAYVTIDELLPYIERRVNARMADALRQFKANASFSPQSFPWAAAHTAAPASTTSLTSTANTYFGLFPFMVDPADASPADYATDFDWVLSGFDETLSSTCRRINGSPNRYIKPPLINAIKAPLATPNLASGTAPVASGFCRWRGGGTRAQCAATNASLTSTFQKSVTIYTDTGCSSAAGSATLSFTRVIDSLSLDATCGGTPVTAFQAGTAGDVHRMNWSCSAITGVSTISLAATDTINNFGGTTYNQLPRTVTTTLFAPAAGSKGVTLNRMRVHPVMPGWFHLNLWYQTSFMAIAPDSAPANSNPCGGGVTRLTAGAATGVQLLAIQAGRNLGANTRPTAAIADYLEGANATGKGGAAPGMSNCTFASAPAQATASSNDQLTVVAP
ncbi:MAG TPA: hypothetical protein VFV64_02545, partial [Permianibacter sp.]|nr:hypothetical protein [Permianibacter sp.]